eukprot:c11878_g1_i1.p1 GENE.c11878_g1_i1~~c11878_g1_i1.p1  ORF type:complete len:443 (+),score=129.85 c11878_g1_i1:1-1329(+)
MGDSMLSTPQTLLKVKRKRDEEPQESIVIEVQPPPSKRAQLADVCDGLDRLPGDLAAPTPTDTTTQDADPQKRIRRVFRLVAAQKVDVRKLDAQQLTRRRMEEQQAHAKNVRYQLFAHHRQRGDHGEDVRVLELVKLEADSQPDTHNQTTQQPQEQVQSPQQQHSLSHHDDSTTLTSVLASTERNDDDSMILLNGSALIRENVSVDNAQFKSQKKLKKPSAKAPRIIPFGPPIPATISTSRTTSTGTQETTSTDHQRAVNDVVLAATRSLGHSKASGGDFVFDTYEEVPISDSMGKALQAMDDIIRVERFIGNWEDFMDSSHVNDIDEYDSEDSNDPEHPNADYPDEVSDDPAVSDPDDPHAHPHPHTHTHHNKHTPHNHYRYDGDGNQFPGQQYDGSDYDADDYGDADEFPYQFPQSQKKVHWYLERPGQDRDDPSSDNDQ